MSDRLHTLTGKVSSKFGTLHCNVGFDSKGGIQEIHIFHPAKHMDTAVGDALDAVGDALTALVRKVSPR